MQKYILILYGPICAGKTTVTKLFLQETPGVFHISADKIKWLISDYTLEKYKGIVSSILGDLAQSAIKQGFPLLVEGNVGIQNEGREKYQQLANDHNYKLIEINIEAPIEILTQRFLTRVENAKEKGSKISLTTIEQMADRYNGYLTYKKTNIPTIDSNLLNPTEIYEKIVSILGES